ncbi:hypothetical protein J3D56_000029 [Erwinia persicina]|uniref:hypothetical protein n=1 Tax=Erwinia persicina TaxID=55211 RepID=UPI0020A02ACC|nr:hypothetical protein [Erwinia persicina]MCP1436593.1 hypothetical protein [Erwinia persicina]
MLVTPVERTCKLQIAITSPPIAVDIDLPEDIDVRNYFLVLSSRVASDIQVLSSGVRAVSSATMTLLDNHPDLLGDEMSERIAKLENSVEHLVATAKAMDAKLDLIVNTIADVKAGNAAIVQNYINYDAKLDKKPSKDEVEKLISQATNKQIIWSIGTLIALALLLYKLLAP